MNVQAHRSARFFARLFGSTLLALVGCTVAGSARAQCSGPNLVEQRFPLLGTEETRWRVCWAAHAKNGLVITGAWFRKSPASPFVRVLWDGRISEIFVPYHDGSPRYYDVTNFTFNLTSVSAADCPTALGGAPISANVCKEVRDRGLAWKDYAQVRRGQELALWGALGAGNYNYVMEWIFRDDGMLIGRVGATAVNLPTKPLMPHMHNPIWRLDVDLDGASGDSVAQMTHAEAGLNANDNHMTVSTEQGFDWSLQGFSGLLVTDASLKNAKGHESGYILMPWNAHGASRHQEAFTQHDMWVTRYKWSEMDAKNLPTYTTPPESVENTDIVLWYKGSMHHHPRDEDGEFLGNTWSGEAHIMWTGFQLMPFNLFDRTPLR
ncbi:MAG: hypothetical protein ABI939_07375 [Anaerolineaceae bacterium]